MARTVGLIPGKSKRKPAQPKPQPQEKPTETTAEDGK